MRYIIGILVSLFVLSFVRAVWGIIQKALMEEVAGATGGDGQAKESAKTANADTTLRKCVTCGTYKPESAMIRYGTGAKSVFFCSKDCEKKANA